MSSSERQRSSAAASTSRAGDYVDRRRDREPSREGERSRGIDGGDIGPQSREYASGLSRSRERQEGWPRDGKPPHPGRPPTSGRRLEPEDAGRRRGSYGRSPEPKAGLGPSSSSDKRAREARGDHGRREEAAKRPRTAELGSSNGAMRSSGNLAMLPAELREAALRAVRERERAQAAAADASAEDEEGEIREAAPPAWKSASSPPRPTSRGPGDSRAGSETLSGTPPQEHLDLHHGMIKPRSAADIAADELGRFQQRQEVDVDVDTDAPVAMKASPSVSADDEDLIPGRPEGEEEVAEALAPEMPVTKSRWLLDDEDAEQNKAEQAVEAREELLLEERLNARERAEMEAEATPELGDNASEGGGSEAEASPRREINMLAACRSVDEYERLNKISEGTYGYVHRAREIVTGRICALKQIKMDREKDGFPLTSIREINILLSLSHPNIVNVSEVVVGKKLDAVFMVMEFMEHDLKDLMETMDHPFSISEVKNLMQQLLRGIAHLHHNWVLHRDLKTSNILYNNAGELKICDFGLARQYGSPLHPYTQNVVTQYYRAIELLLGERKYSTAIDMWSLGCIMGELLTKNVLFPGKSEMDMINKIFDLLGTPTEENWPSHKKLPGMASLNFAPRADKLRKRFPASTIEYGQGSLSERGMDLLRRLLALDPLRRITAEEALHHPWFDENPRPKHDELMPTFPTTKDGTNLSSRRGGARKHAVHASPEGGQNYLVGRAAEVGSLFGGRK